MDKFKEDYKNKIALIKELEEIIEIQNITIQIKDQEIYNLEKRNNYAESRISSCEREKEKLQQTYSLGKEIY